MAEAASSAMDTSAEATADGECTDNEVAELTRRVESAEREARLARHEAHCMHPLPVFDRRPLGGWGCSTPGTCWTPSRAPTTHRQLTSWA